MSNTRKIMMRTAISGVAVAGAAAIILPSFTAQAETPAAECEATVLAGVNGEADSTSASAVDSSGNYVAGHSGNGDGEQVATLWEDGEAQAIEVDGAVGSTLLDVNAEGEAIGTFQDADGGQQPFVYTGDKAVPIPEVEDAENVEVAGINDEGQIAGSVAETKQDFYPVVFDLESLEPTELEVPEDVSATAADIDNSGNVGGYTVADGEQLPYLWEDGGAGEELPGAEAGEVGYTLNAYDQGWALGELGGPKMVWEPEADEPTEYTDMDWPLTINGSGQIAGYVDELPVTGTVDGELTELPLPDEFATGRAGGISDDGSVLAGNAKDESEENSAAVMWTCE